MILKAHEINKINPDTNKFILFYGENEGYKNQSIKNLTQNIENIFKYDEKEILDNSDSFLENFFLDLFLKQKKL